MIKTEISISSENDEVIFFIMPSNELDRNLLNTIKPDSKITVVSIKGAQFHGKAVPEGTIVISPRNVEIEGSEQLQSNS